MSDAWRAVQAADEEAMAALCTQARQAPSQRAAAVTGAGGARTDAEADADQGGDGGATSAPSPLHAHVASASGLGLASPLPLQGDGGSGSGSGSAQSGDLVAPVSVDSAIGRSSAVMGCAAASFSEATAFVGAGGRPAPSGPRSTRSPAARPRETALWPTTHAVTSCARAAGASTLVSSSMDAETDGSRQWRAVGDIVIPAVRAPPSPQPSRGSGSLQR